MAISKAIGSVSGFLNLLVNLAYRFFSQEDSENYYDMSVAIMEDDVEACGESFGVFISRLLMVEMPEVTSAPSYKAVGSL